MGDARGGFRSTDEWQLLHLSARFAVNLAQNGRTPWKAVAEHFFAKCPELPTANAKDAKLRLSMHHRTAVVSLGVFLLASNLQHQDKIINYLLELLKVLPEARFKDEYFVSGTAGAKLPVLERFAFNLNMILTDAAGLVSNEKIAQNIVKRQMETLEDIVHRIVKHARDDNLNKEKEKYLVFVLVPLCLGMFRTLFRFDCYRPCTLYVYSPGARFDSKLQSAERTAKSGSAAVNGQKTEANIAEGKFEQM